jgi:hypothetical protein
MERQASICSTEFKNMYTQQMEKHVAAGKQRQNKQPLKITRVIWFGSILL